MAETSKSFWGKFKKKNLKPTSESYEKVPSQLLEMFPSVEIGDLYNVYHCKCNDSFMDTVNYLTKDQPANLHDEVPLHVIIESLKHVHTDKSRYEQQEHGQMSKEPDLFAQTPTHILSHIFSFSDPETWGKITRLNRECRLLSKALLAAITEYDFSYYYHKFCQPKARRGRKARSEHSNHRNTSHNLRIVRDDGLKLISHINAFPYLRSLSLRATMFSKWYSFSSVLNKQHIKTLNLSSSLNLYDDDISVIMETFPSLQVLDLSNCLEISDLAMTHILEYEQTDQLNTIYLNNTPQITKNGIKQLMTYKKSITSLEWKGAKYGNVSECFQGAKHLKYLNLSSNSNMQQLVLTLDNKHGELELNLSNCPRLNFVDVRITHLRKISITQCLALRECRVSTTAQLQELNCKNCATLQVLAVPCAALQTAVLAGCNALDLEILLHENNFIMQSLRSQNLHSLDLSQINHLSDDEVQEILQANQENDCPLKALSVSGCRSLSNTTMVSVQRCFEKPVLISDRIKKRRKRSRSMHHKQKNRRYSS